MQPLEKIHSRNFFGSNGEWFNPLKVLKTVIASNGLLYPTYLRLGEPDIAEMLPTNQTDVFISAYPRSGNDFAKQLIKRYNANLEISSHFHRAGALKLALKKRVPVVGIVRDPLECISSAMIKYTSELNLSSLPMYPLFDYVHFHNIMLKRVSEMSLIKFDDLINRPAIFYEKLENDLGIKSMMPAISLEDNYSEIEKKLYDPNLACNQITAQIKGPSPEKDKLKEKAKDMLRGTSYLDKAYSLYHSLTKYT